MSKIFFFVLVFLLLLISLSTISYAANKPVEGYVYLSDNTTAVNNVSIRIHVATVLGNCTTSPVVYSSSIGYYITDLANLKKNSDNSDCGSFWQSGDNVYASGDGSTATISVGNGTTSITTIPDASGAAFQLPNMTLTANVPTTFDDYAYSGIWRNQNASITITEVCSAGCNYTRYCTDATNSCTPNLNITGGAVINVTSENITYLRYHSQDTLGNTQAVQSVNVSLDFTGPLITDDYAFDDIWINSSQTVNFTVNDSLSGISNVSYCTGSGCNPSTGTVLNSPYQISYTTDQNNVVRYISYDNAGNPSLIGNYTVKIDKTAPSTTDDYAFDNDWVNQNANITLTADCSISGCSFTRYCTDAANTCTPGTPYSGAISITAENITYLRYHSQDNAGNTESINSLAVKIDKTNPLAGTVLIEGGAIYATSTTLNFNWSDFNDSLSGIVNYYYNYSDNGGTNGGFSDASSPGSISNAAQGNVTVYVWAEDDAGNIGTSSSDNIFVDSINPSISLVNVTENSGGAYLYYSGAILYYSTIGNSEFSAKLNASDSGSGLANASGETQFGDSPIDLTEKVGNFVYELNYSIEGQSFSGLLDFTVYDIAGNSQGTTLTVQKDDDDPTVNPDDGITGWSADNTTTFTWTSSDGAGSGIVEFLWNVDNGANTSTALSNVTLPEQVEGNHTFNIYAIDRVGNVGFGSHDFAIDVSPPDTPQNIADEGVYDTDGAYLISWDAVNDTSGIVYVLYERFNLGAWSLLNSSIINNNYSVSGSQNNRNYTYIVSALNGAGLSSSNSTESDGIFVDLIAPTFSNWQNTDIQSDSTGNLTVNVTVTESESGLNATPLFRYKYGALGNYTNFTDMTLVSGSKYTYNIPEPPGGWDSLRGDTVSWQVFAVDRAGNNASSAVQTHTVTAINEIIFNVRDRILLQNLTNVTVTGGTQCAGGCLFNSTITIQEENGVFSFTFTKSGFASNTTGVTVNSADQEFNITMSDNENPSVVFINFSANISDDQDEFTVLVYANISDNFNLSTATLNYSLSQGVSESALVNFTFVEGKTYVASFGPYNLSFLMNSNITATDLYGNTNLTLLSQAFFIFAPGTLNVTFPPQLDPIGTQTLTVGVPYSLTVHASDLDNDNITYSSNSSFFTINNITGLISFTPTNADVGRHHINISASDGTNVDYEIVLFKIGNDVLELKEGWNLISTPDIANESIEDIFLELGNGNWGCGRGGVPTSCVEADGDFVGNFTKIMGYNKSAEEWISFNPTDFYLTIDSQELLAIDAKEGYWINMTATQNVTLVFNS